MNARVFVSGLFCVVTSHIFGQLYTLDASKVNEELKTSQFKMGNPGAVGKEIKINSQYMTLGGKAIVPVMGEMHYSRVPKEQWEENILKMKACGINIIATYIFWIHHEEIEEQFDWSGNKDLRSFVQLCGKHGMLVYPRIGPWSHGEVRNGGTPDWILLKKNMKTRSNHPVYQQYVERWYQQIASQIKDLLYKDGGPIIGIQLENEYTRGKNGEEHILWLKQTAQKFGLDVPMYTVTGWSNGSVPENEVIPLWGGYPDEPWAAHAEKNTGCSNFQFDPFRDDEKIGNDLAKKKDKYMDYSNYPFFTCEMGVGIENTEHRRLVIGPIDGYGMAAIKVGSGSNLVGYYVFAGGSNPHGTLTSMEENKDETGYWNKNPEISYDFQAAVKESGELAPSYFQVKKFHYFLNEFGETLAPMVPVLGPKNDDLQYAVRVKDNTGFLFGINYCRWNTKPIQKNVQFSIQLKNEKLVFPGKPIDIEDSSVFIWPFNLSLEGAILKYATAQPLCRLNVKGEPVWIFIQNTKALPEFCFDAGTVDNVQSSNGKLSKNDNNYIITSLKPGTDCIISFTNKKGTKQKIIILSEEESNHVWLFRNEDKKRFFLSNANMYMDNTQLHLFGPSEIMSFLALDADSMLYLNGKMLASSGNGLFSEYRCTVPLVTLPLEMKSKNVLDGAQWLKSSVKSVDKKNYLFHKFFVKEFNLGNPSRIKSAKIIIATETPVNLQINNAWVNQNISANAINNIDITGYLQKDENMLMLAFPFYDGDKTFAARVIVDYANTDRIELLSDLSWQTKEGYTYPAFYSRPDGLTTPETATERTQFNRNWPDFSEYSLSLPANYLKGLNNVYLNISYYGDKARCRINQLLVADDFNSNVSWHIGLKRLGNQLEVQNLKFEILPLDVNSRIYFDNPLQSTDIGKTILKEMKVIPEYMVNIDLKSKE